MFSLSAWRRARILRRSRLDDAAFRRVLARYAFLDGLDDGERARLRELVVLFLHEKSVQGAAGLEVTDEVRLSIAVQACTLILGLGLDAYRGWVEIIVYPDEFRPEYEWTDQDGVVHVSREWHTGQAWLSGPVILSWEDVRLDYGDGINVVIHEFAHKIDMLNGEADGYPPLHAGMRRDAWTTALTRAYERFSRRVSDRRPSFIDPYAAQSPAEFFAVMSEAFFEMPEVVRREYPDVYEQFRQFYRQDPHARAAAIASAASAPGESDR